MSQDVPVQFLEGVRLFNEEEFFECHDVLEELWSEAGGEERQFLQGMIQASVALFHFGNENLGGALKLYASARKNLEPYPGAVFGLDVPRFLDDFHRCFAELIDARDTLKDATALHNSGVGLQDELVPKIILEESAT